MTRRLWCAALVVVLALSGCESRQEKLDRLQGEQSLALLMRISAERRLDAAIEEHGRGSGIALAYADSLRDAIAYEAMARNELRRFLGY